MESGGDEARRYYFNLKTKKKNVRFASFTVSFVDQNWLD